MRQRKQELCNEKSRLKGIVNEAQSQYLQAQCEPILAALNAAISQYDLTAVVQDYSGAPKVYVTGHYTPIINEEVKLELAAGEQAEISKIEALESALNAESELLTAELRVLYGSGRTAAENTFTRIVEKFPPEAATHLDALAAIMSTALEDDLRNASDAAKGDTGAN